MCDEDSNPGTPFAEIIGLSSGGRKVAGTQPSSPLKMNNRQSSVFFDLGSLASNNKNCTEDLFSDFDKLPKTADDEKGHFRKSGKKEEDRRKLDGDDCDELQEYLKSLQSQYPTKLRRLVNNCSRHCSNGSTTAQSGLRNTTMLTTKDAGRTGVSKTGVTSPPARRKRHEKKFE